VFSRVSRLARESLENVPETACARGWGGGCAGWKIWEGSWLYVEAAFDGLRDCLGGVAGTESGGTVMEGGLFRGTSREREEIVRSLPSGG